MAFRRQGTAGQLSVPAKGGQVNWNLSRGVSRGIPCEQGFIRAALSRCSQGRLGVGAGVVVDGPVGFFVAQYGFNVFAGLGEGDGLTNSSMPW